MPLAATGDLVAAAVAAGRGLPAFNVITLEHAEAIAAGAQAAGCAAVAQISQNAVRYHGGRLLPLARATAEVARAASVPIALHLDHVDDPELLRLAAEAGCSSVMFDASALPYEENVRATAEAARWGHGRGLWVEGELGRVGGKPDSRVGEKPDSRVGEKPDSRVGEKPDSRVGGKPDSRVGGDGPVPSLSAHAPGVRTDPAEAAAYAAATGIDALAVAVGNSHAMTERSARLDRDLIARLRGAVRLPLVLHGSSGVPDDELRAAVGAGITKINIGTALNIALTGALRSALFEDPDGVDPRGPMAAARDRMAEAVAHFARLLDHDSPVRGIPN